MLYENRDATIKFGVLGIHGTQGFSIFGKTGGGVVLGGWEAAKVIAQMMECLLKDSRYAGSAKWQIERLARAIKRRSR